MIDLIKSLVRTEKATILYKKNQYTFDVSQKLTKPKIKALIEELYKVEIRSIQTHNRPRKKSGASNGKRAIVTLKANQTIPIYLSEK